MPTLIERIKGLLLPGSQILTTHKLASGETLSGLALKYYGNATKPYWTLIANANLALVGENGRKGQPGMVLKIPVLPSDMKQ
jgi:nucleoid-associated protein YgaU